MKKSPFGLNRKLLPKYVHFDLFSPVLNCFVVRPAEHVNVIPFDGAPGIQCALDLDMIIRKLYLDAAPQRDYCRIDCNDV
jgi:hypothetical protein